MDYGEILSRAWKIVWKFKILWLFGLLASCGSSVGSGGGANTNVNTGSTPGNSFEQFFNQLPPQLQSLAHTLQQSYQDGSLWIYILFGVLALICLSVLFSLVAMAINSVGRIGIINGTALADEGATKLTFSHLWDGMKPYFKRVFIFSFLLSIAMILIGFIMILPIILLAIITLGCGLILIIPVLFVLSWLVSVWQDQTIVAIVTEDLQIRDAASRAFELIKANFWRYLGMSAILYIGGFIVGLLITLPFILAILPGMASLIYGISESSTAFIGAGAVMMLCFCALLIPISMAISGLTYAFIGASWTLTFRRLTGKLPSRDDNEIVRAPINDREIIEREAE